MAASVSVE